MTAFDESAHPRGEAGRFTEVERSAAEVSLGSVLDPAALAKTRVEADDSDVWPPSPTVVTHHVTGHLADRIRGRLNAPAGSAVTLRETTSYGGYSEYTQENSTEFEVITDVANRVFYPASGTLDWKADAQRPERIRDSVFARFDAWLRVAEDPLVLFDEWFEFDDESGRLVRYRTKPDTVASRALRDRYGWFDHAYIDGFNDGSGRNWRMDVAGAADSRGFTPILSREELAYAEGTVMTPAVARRILEPLTDRILPGTEGY